MQVRPGGRRFKISRRHRIGCVVVFACVAVAAAVGSVVLTRLWRAEPVYWQQYQSSKIRIPVQERRSTAARFESRMVTQISADELAPRTITLPLADVNAWLDQRLGRWMANQGLEMPPEVGEVMLTTRDGDIVLAFEVRTEHIEQVFSMFFGVAVSAAGQAQVQLKKIRGGRLRVPRGMVLDLVDQAGSREAVNVLVGEQLIEPALQIDGSRQLRVQAIHVFDDRLEMQVLTEPALDP